MKAVVYDLPQVGAIALQGTADITAGMSVLINGVGGGPGAFAIQLAKRAGATFRPGIGSPNS
ncbi:hypothetical protein [Nocardia otitidiscaviarum]|uniref:hypothetical protein n=1 Tax=Nocardia otitidiscaviarum TaxID=1823 RepID=UPI001E2BCC3E|nr:hypothetical protein [Nocardia otitidiscaviarum]